MFKKVNFAIFLLGVSMLGIIALQSYWLYESFQRENRMFRRDIFRSMVSSVNAEIDSRVKKLYGYQDVYNSAFYNNIFKEGKGPNLNAQRDSTYVFGISLSANRIFFNNDENRVESYEVSNLNGQRTERFKVINKKDTIYEKVIDNKSGNDEHQRKEFDRMLMSMASRMFSADDMSFLSYNEDELLKALDTELKSRNFDLDYHLAFLDMDNRIIKNLKGEIKEKDLDDAIILNMRHALPNVQLAMWVPKQNLYLLFQNSLLGISSILMILISIFSMSFIIRKFFSQKKIGEIRRDFMNNMTHELKTPISTVGLALEAMENFDVLSDKEKTNRYIGIARKENQRLGMLVEKVLKMSAYERENIQLKWENIDVNKAIEEVVKNLSFQIENKGAKVEVKLDAKSPLLNVDKVHFTNVIYNLIDNALKYSEENPLVEITSRNSASKLIIEVKDQGIGIPTGYHSKIFDKFFRVPSGNLHNVKGYGLGLSYVANIVQKFQGEIKVSSNSPKGSIFSLKFNTDTQRND